MQKRSEKRYASACAVDSLKSKFDRRVDHLNMLIERDDNFKQRDSKKTLKVSQAS